MTPTERLATKLNNPDVAMTPEEKEEEERMKRIFDLVPRKKRSLRKKTTVNNKHKTTPKWLLQVLNNLKIVEAPKLIIEKTLDFNDIDSLLIPFKNMITNKFLTSDEHKILEDEEGISKEGKIGVGAILLDKRNEQWIVVLKKVVLMNDSWRMRSRYLLSGAWRKIVEGNGLRDGDNISLWCFRRHGILIFALDFCR